ncbi:hypothetical protein J3A83DRAFT_4082776, partial [Scleroderma citrinum]
PPMHIKDTIIHPSPSHKFLGVILNQELHWREQANHMLAKGVEYMLLMKQLSATSWGIPAKLTWQLYQAVVVPRVTYMASVWMRLVYSPGSDSPWWSSIGIAKQLTRIQQMAAITILRAMKSSATGTLNVHTFLPPT